MNRAFCLASAAALALLPLAATSSQPAAGGKEAFFNRASPGYFRTMGTRVMAGRDFNDRDTLSSPKVAIVNEMFARKFLGGANPVGRHVLELTKHQPLLNAIIECLSSIGDGAASIRTVEGANGAVRSVKAERATEPGRVVLTLQTS